ncbi:DNA breaking-rejoining enzyme [Gracilaria domingensis]|nr:DNA breaking-rejoining enzyme [Gracilaria domingensis]
MPISRSLCKAFRDRRSLTKRKHTHVVLKPARIRANDQQISSHIAMPCPELTALPQHGLTLFVSFPLLAARLQQETRKRYLSAYSKFIATVSSLPTSVMALDQLLLKYIQQVYDSNPSPGKRQEMTNLIAHIIFVVPDLRCHLGLARKAVGAWKRCVPHQSSLPLTLLLIRAIVGRLEETRRHDSAVAISIAWGAFLRASETISLRKEDIALPGDSRISSLGSSQLVGVLVRHAKTRTTQFTFIHETAVISYVCSHMSNRTSKTLFNITYNGYLRDVKAAALFSGISGQLTPHSARLGGALYSFCNGESAETIALHGRRQSSSSLRYYLSNGRALLQKLQFTGKQHARLHRYARSGEKIMQPSRSNAWN